MANPTTRDEREPCPWCDGAGIVYADEEDGIQYGMGFPCRRCVAFGWLFVDDEPCDAEMSELEADHPASIRDGGASNG